ncbi:hypothetical protein ILUMI_15200 [Ignelater luminosus]|uniref:Peptidase aspartic putative domain-containing protein n=1 Tax=Ignelater luminosus TaxID=2038154 RepID=A0A8K0CUJ5_IGNLU|nr:hypothetical protein ILUMI_15200 [Ignelater luminosus]
MESNPAIKSQGVFQDKNDNESQVQLTLCNNNKGNTNVILPVVKIGLYSSDGQLFVVKGLLDSGSQLSFITDELYKKLKISSFPKSLSIFGITKQASKTQMAVHVKIYSCTSSYNTEILCSIMTEITNNLPTSYFDKNEISLPKNVNLKKRFKRDPKLFLQYKEFIDEYATSGDAKMIDLKEYEGKMDTTAYFLAHHPVIRNDKRTTQIRVVFDESVVPKISWDETLPPDLYDMWKTFAESLISMPSFEIKRDLNFAEAETTDVLGFCDASNVAYGCAIYCRVIKKGGSILTNLVCSKSRISPINEKLTIPRAELNSALLLTLLIVKVHKILSRFINNVYIFSDSWVVLSWLKLNPYKLNNYVANRVSKINGLTKNFKWNFIESNQNPSDLISRGTTPKTLANSRLWWEGPEFLTQPHLSMQSEIESLENIPEVKSYVATTKAEYLPVLTKFSNLQKLQRVIAYVLRFIHNTKNKREKLMRNLTAGELDNSLNMTIKLEQ